MLLAVGAGVTVLLVIDTVLLITGLMVVVVVVVGAIVLLLGLTFVVGLNLVAKLAGMKPPSWLVSS